MPVVSSIVLGGLSAATGIMGAFGSAGQAKAQAAAAEQNRLRNNFERALAVDAENREKDRQWMAQWQRNRQIERSSTEATMEANAALRNSVLNKRQMVSSQARQSDASLLSSTAARGLTGGTAKLLMNQNNEATRKSLAQIKVYENQAAKNIDATHQNRLAQRTNNYYGYSSFMPQQAASADASGSILATGLVTGVLGGISTGIGTYQQFGGNLFGGGGGGSAGQPQPGDAGFVGPVRPGGGA